MTSFMLRQATRKEFRSAVDWAAAEGWNPGLDDLDAFYEADPDGFLMGFLGDEPVSSISVVKYGPDFGFLGFYIVVPAHRGKQMGLKTWQAGMSYLGDRIIGLDGVVDQQDNYRKSGFVFCGNNIRFTGPSHVSTVRCSAVIRDVVTADLTALLVYDRFFFAGPRPAFISAWIGDTASRRTTKVAVKDNEIAGFAVIRECREGYKIGPLFADNQEIAEGLVSALCTDVAPGAPIFLDIPEANSAAKSLAENAGMVPVFETARMYNGAVPDLPVHRTFGITTFELG